VEAREALEALARSGESLAAFAVREGLSPERLYRWRAKLSRTAFVEVSSEGLSTSGGGVFEVVVGEGRVVRVPPDFVAVALRRLLVVLEEGRC
jgi:transposase-like protein